VRIRADDATLHSPFVTTVAIAPANLYGSKRFGVGTEFGPAAMIFETGNGIGIAVGLSPDVQHLPDGTLWATSSFSVEEP